MPSIKNLSESTLSTKTNEMCDCIKNANRRKLSSRQEISLSVRDKSKINIPCLRLGIVKRREWKHNFRTFPLIKNSIKKLTSFIISRHRHSSSNLNDAGIISRSEQETSTFLFFSSFNQVAFSGAQSIPLSLFAVTESDINNSRLLSFRARSRLATESRLVNVDFWFQEGSDMIALTK